MGRNRCSYRIRTQRARTRNYIGLRTVGGVGKTPAPIQPENCTWVVLCFRGQAAQPIPEICWFFMIGMEGSEGRSGWCKRKAVRSRCQRPLLLPFSAGALDPVLKLTQCAHSVPSVCAASCATAPGPVPWHRLPRGEGSFVGPASSRPLALERVAIKPGNRRPLFRVAFTSDPHGTFNIARISGLYPWLRMIRYCVA